MTMMQIKGTHEASAEGLHDKNLLFLLQRSPTVSLETNAPIHGVGELSLILIILILTGAFFPECPLIRLNVATV